MEEKYLEKGFLDVYIYMYIYVCVCNGNCKDVWIG